MAKRFNPNEVYDITPQERVLMEKRKAIRDNLKSEFKKKSTNPFRGVGGYIVCDLVSIQKNYSRKL